METMKEFLSFVNTKIFNDYHIKVSFTRIQKDKLRYNAYKLETINGINELVEYRIMRGLNLYDTDNIRIIPNEKKYQYKESFENFDIVRENYLKEQKMKKDIESNKEILENHNNTILQEIIYNSKYNDVIDINDFFGKINVFELKYNEYKTKQITEEMKIQYEEMGKTEKKKEQLTQKKIVETTNEKKKSTYKKETIQKKLKQTLMKNDE
jgi:hypothetical protein